MFSNIGMHCNFRKILVVSEKGNLYCIRYTKLHLKQTKGSTAGLTKLQNYKNQCCSETKKNELFIPIELIIFIYYFSLLSFQSLCFHSAITNIPVHWPSKYATPQYCICNEFWYIHHDFLVVCITHWKQSDLNYIRQK